jgi:16S rRNA (cytosine1402-N4)-methyltransferase
MTGIHIPVMLAEVLQVLQPRDGGLYLDGTFGGGGYARAILTAADCRLHAIDRDPDAIARGTALVAESASRLQLHQGRFGEMATMLPELTGRLDGVVLDLGISSFQIDQAERGFSFRQDGPLDMRMEKDGPSAADLVNRLGEAELADILYELGEERRSRRIARAIVAAREEAPIETTGRLVSIIHSVMPRDPSGIDSATRSFQGLRLAVNDELGEVERGLAAALTLLAPGGRLVVVAFHSLEDRIVKRFMQQAAGRSPGVSRYAPTAMQAAPKAGWKLATPNALRPGEAEVSANPRSRSARLRALEKLEEALCSAP